MHYSSFKFKIWPFTSFYYEIIAIFAINLVKKAFLFTVEEEAVRV